MKKIFILIIFIFSLLIILSGCSHEEVSSINQDKVDEVIYYIDDLPSNIKISHKDSVYYIMDMYNELNDEEKKLVNNYQKLRDAYNKIQAFENEDSLMESILKSSVDSVLDSIPDVIDNNKWDLKLYPTSEYKDEYYEFTIIFTYESDNVNVITNTGKVYHDTMDVDVNFKVTATYRNYSYSDQKKVKVLADSFKNLNQGQVIIAYCYEYTGIREKDLHTIDIVNYCFAQIRENSSGFYIDISELNQINKIKELHDSGIRVCMSIGGWRDDSDDWIPYQNAAKTDEGRKQVANAILEILERYDLDGIDMDWEYPRSDDKNNFTLLMKEIRDTLKAKNERYIVSAAVPSSLNNRRYDYVALNEILDYFNVMTYDMETSSNTSYQSALYTSTYSRYSTDDAVKSIINAGVDKKKVVLGMAFYGKKYTNVDSTNNGRGQKYSTKTFYNYTDIYYSYLNKGITSYYDSAAGSNYLYDEENKVFICFEGEETLKAKCEYAISKDIGGIMWWSYEDDKTGTLMSYLDEMYPKLKHLE